MKRVLQVSQCDHSIFQRLKHLFRRSKEPRICLGLFQIARDEPRMIEAEINFADAENRILVVLARGDDAYLGELYFAVTVENRKLAN
mgnify:CR=1 FL=1